MSSDVELISGRTDTHLYVKHIATELASGLKSFDSSPYDKTRLIRVCNSLHGKSELYKIPITYSELKTMSSSEIMAMALHQREHEFISRPCGAEYIYQLIEEFKNTDTSVRKPSTTKGGILQGLRNGFSNGERNGGITSIAGMLHSKGLSDDMVLEYALLANEKNDPPLPDRDVETIVNSVIKYKIDTQYREIKSNDIKTMDEAYKIWRDQKLRIRNSGIKISSGFRMMDKGLYTFDEGKVLMIAARPGVGKTLLGMQVAKNLAESLGGMALFATLEMQSSAVFYRSARIDTSENCAEMENDEFTDYLLDHEEACLKVTKNWNNMKMVDKDNLTLDQIEAYFNAANVNNEFNVLIIDYLGLISGTNDYKGMSDVAREMKNLAKRLNTRVILLVQLSRKAGDGTQEVFMDHIADSGQVEAAADIILGMWLSPTDSSRVHVKSCKNRDDKRDRKYDLIQRGMAYSEEDYLPDDTEERVVMKGSKKW